jgi:hypothetical protein
VIEDAIDESKHISVDNCYEIGSIPPCDSGDGRLDDTSECSACIAGQYSVLSRLGSCSLCPTGFYNDQAKQDKCKECKAAVGKEICAAVPGATSQAGGATLPAEYLFVTNTSSSSIDAVNVTDLDPSETEVGKVNLGESDKYALYFSLLIPPLAIVMLHRYLPLGFKTLDLFFAGSNYIDDTVSLSLYVSSLPPLLLPQFHFAHSSFLILFSLFYSPLLPLLHLFPLDSTPSA